MDATIILGAIAAAPVVLALVFRVNAVFLFLSAVAGSLFVTYVGDDAELVIDMVAKGGNIPTITRFALLIVPVALTILLMRKTLPPSKFLLHIVPLLATGVCIGIFALPLLSSNAQNQIFNKPYGNVIKDAQDLAVSATAFLILLLSWFSYRNKPDKKHGKRH